MAHAKRQINLEEFLNPDEDQALLPVGGPDILRRGATGLTDPANTGTVVPDPGIETSGLTLDQLREKVLNQSQAQDAGDEELPELEQDRFQRVIPSNFFSPRDPRSLRGG